MKFLIGCSADWGFLVGELTYDNHFSFTCDCLMPYRESYVDYDEIAENYWDDMPDKEKLRWLEEADCSPAEAREIIREDECELLNWEFGIDDLTLPNLDDDIFYDLIAFDQHDPRKDDPDLFVAEEFFNRLMAAWDKYQLVDSPEALEEFNALTYFTAMKEYDSKNKWKEFVADKIIEYF